MIRIGHAIGAPGQVVSVEVSLSVPDATTEIAGTQNDIALPAPATVVSTENGRPACQRNLAIEQPATTFGYLPSPCTYGTNCDAVRAIVFSFAGPEPIPDGAVLYTCPVAIAAEAIPGSFLPLACSADGVLGGSDPDGEHVEIGCEAGGIDVVTEEPG